MFKLSSIALLALGTGATIIAARPHSREGELATYAIADSSTAELATTVSGRVALLGSNGRDARDVESAVVYLEPLAAPRPVVTPPPVVPPPVVAAPVVAPRDTVRVLWDAVRELRQTVAELREALRQVRLQFLGAPDARAAAAPPSSSATRPLDSTVAAAPPGATPVNVPTGAPTGSPGSRVTAPRPAARVIPGATMAMRQKTFEPHVRIVESGGLVDYPNRDPFSHNVFSTTPGGAFDLGLYPRGESRGVVFRRMGAYAIYCNIHSKMSAFIVSVPTPYHTRPDADGRFSLANVPAGRYRLHVWHERAPDEVTTVVVVGERPVNDVAVTLDGRTFQSAAHLNKFGQPYRAATRDAY